MMLFERVRIVARQLAGSETKLAAQVGLPQRKLNGYFNETSQKNLWDLLPIILERYPHVRRDWLYFGEGEMTDAAPRVAVPPLTTAAPPLRAARAGETVGNADDALRTIARLREKLDAAQEANARLAETNAKLSEEMIRLNEERRRLEKGSGWDKPEDDAVLQMGVPATSSDRR